VEVLERSLVSTAPAVALRLPIQLGPEKFAFCRELRVLVRHHRDLPQ
jgi:hypothetical protein